MGIPKIYNVNRNETNKWLQASQLDMLGVQKHLVKHQIKHLVLQYDDNT